MPLPVPIVIFDDTHIEASCFTGYALVGADVVLGEAGHSEYQHETRRSVPPFEDGCYVVLEKTDTGFTLGVDYTGASKIYIYEHAGRWALSNSFTTLVEAVQKRSWPIRPVAHVLDALTFETQMFQQLYTFSTPAEQIRLVPRRNVITVTNGSLKEKSVPIVHREPDGNSYNEALEEYLSVWLGRLMTLHADTGISYSLDVSGGVDSRTVLALFLSARQYFEFRLNSRTHFRSIRANAADMRVAQELAAIYSFSLNRDPEGLKRGKLSENARYVQWRNFSLGVYAPIYWGPQTRPEHHVAFGGQGGESHRQAYRGQDIMRLLQDRARYFRSEKTYEHGRQALMDTVEVLRRQDPGTPTSLAHYHEFRDRFHGGLHALETVRLLPLASSLLHRASRSLSPESRLRGQALRDIMACAAPGVLGLPYDDEGKAADLQTLHALSKPIPLRPRDGRVYGDLETLENPASSELGADGDVWDLLSAELHNISVRDARSMPDRMWETAGRRLDEARMAGRFAKAKDGTMIHRVILEGLVTK